MSACNCERLETAYEANPNGHNVTCPRWGTAAPHRLDVAGLYAAIDAAQAEVRRLRALPVLRTCADCTWMGGCSGESVVTPYTCGLASHLELPDDDIVPGWCPLRGDCGAQDAP